MKKIGFIAILLLFITSSNTVLAGKIKLLKGDLKFLKGIKELNIEFDYSNLKVGKFDTEEEYVQSKVKEKNKKEAGTGDTFEERWESAKVKRFPLKFIELFNKYLEKNNIKAEQNNTEVKYKLVVETTFIEIGFNVGVMKKPAYCDYNFKFIEVSSGETVAELEQKNVVGSQVMDFDFDVDSRVAESYALAGKSLANFILKKLK